MIKRIKMVNIKKHANLEVEFTSGVNVIVGPNYAGKSTLLQGILFGLFGIRAVPGNSDDFWSDDSTGSSVDLEFTVAGNDIVVRRTRSSATLYEGGSKTATGVSTVNEKMASLLGIPMADFLLIKYSRQKETANLLSFGAANLNGLIERVGGISLVKKAMAQLTTVVSTSKGVLSVKESHPLPPLRAAVRDAKLELGKGTSNESELGVELERLSEVRSESVSRHKKAEIALNLRLDYQVNIGKLDGVISALETQKENITGKLGALEPRSESDADDLAKKAATVLKKVADIASASLSKRRLERQLEEYESKCMETEATVKDCKAELLELCGKGPTENLEHYRRESTTAGVAETRALEERDSISTRLESGACDKCGRPFEDGWDASQVEEELKLARAEAINASILARASESQLEAAVADSAYMENLEQRIYNLEIKLGSSSQKYDEINNQIVELTPGSTGDVSKLEEQGRKYLKEERLVRAAVQEEESLTNSLLNYNAELKEAHNEKNDLPAPADMSVTKKEVRSLRLASDEATDEMHAAELALSSLQSTCVGLQRELDDAEYYLKLAEEDNEVVAAHEKRLSQASELKKFLSNNREAFMQHTWDRLLSQASVMCEHSTGGVMTSMQREGDVFSYVEEGRTRALSSASGGQESLMGLSLKVALSESIPSSLECLLLDEVTADLDEPHSSAITSLLGNVGCQIITVSHRDMDRSGQYNVIPIQG